jgi:hypothetical protein
VIAFTIDGVLRKPLDVEAQDYGARLLLLGLMETYRVVLLGGEDQARDEHFLTINGIADHMRLEPILPVDGEGVEVQRYNQIKRLQSEGLRFEFAVVPDPDLAKDLYAEGTPVLLYLHPTFSTPSARPDHVGGLRPWAELTDEVEFQLTAKAKQMKERV